MNSMSEYLPALDEDGAFLDVEYSLSASQRRRLVTARRQRGQQMSRPCAASDKATGQAFRAFDRQSRLSKLATPWL